MIDIQMSIKMDEDEKIDCPCCGTTHKVKVEDIAVTLGQCEDCEMEIIMIPDSIEKGTRQ